MSSRDPDARPRFKVGLTWRAMLAMITAAILFVPASIYLYLASGGGLALAAAYVIVILASAFSRMYGSPLSKQELFIMYTLVGAIGGNLPIYYWLVFRGYYVQNPISLAFSLRGMPLRDLVPIWMAPPETSASYAFRSLLNFDWLPAIATITTFSVLGFITEIALGILLSLLYIEEEPLAFPIATVDASMIETLSERKGSDMLFFLVALSVGVIYGTALYATPLTGGRPLIPYPWVDLTWLTQNYLPGAVIGIATDPATFLYGAILPLPVTGMMFLGSLLTYVGAHVLTLTTFKGVSPPWVADFYTGMNIAAILQRSYLDLWLSPFIGLSLGMASFLVLFNWRKVVAAFRSLTRLGRIRVASGYPEVKILVGAYLLGTVVSVVLYIFLIPEVPWWIPFFMSVVVSFFMAVVGTRIFGELGISPMSTAPYDVWKALLYATPYTGYPGWIFYPVIAGTGTPWLVNTTKVAYLTETNPIDYYKGLAIAFVINIIGGLLFMDFFWRISPIPAITYPYTMIQWPIYALSDCLFATRRIMIHYDHIAVGFGTSWLLGAVGALALKTGIPFNSVALIGGMFTPPPYTVMVFLMSLLSHLVFKRYLGADRWNAVKGIVVAGVIAGLGLVVGLGVSLVLISKASWLWPW